MASNSENFDAYKKTRIGDVSSASKEPTIQELINQGNILLAKDNVKTSVSELKNAIVDDKTNPFLRARIQILKGMNAFQRNEIEMMERTNYKDNRWYDEFCHQVRLLGESFQK